MRRCGVSQLKWSSLKNERLKKTRGVSFEELMTGEMVSVIRHPMRPDQQVILIWYRDYVWAVPYVEKEGEIFLKTLYPSRKYTKWFKEGRFA